MKKNIIYFIISLLLISFITFGDSTNLGSVCEELLIKRAETWNKILTEDYNYQTFYTDMDAVASGKLLEEDLETYIYMKENPTDMERVISVEFQKTKIEKTGSGALLEGEVVWNLEAQEGIESIIGYYRIQMERQKGVWYLVDFEPIE